MKVSKKELEKLIGEHGKIFTVSFEDEDEKEKTVYLKKMNKTIYKSSSALIEKDELTGLESLIKNLWVAGDPFQPIVDDLDALRNFGATIMPMISAKAGTLKKN
jgi:hypothetical protein